MSLPDALLRPFAAQPPRRRLLWFALLVVAPAALLAGLWAQRRLDPEVRPITVSRAQALEIARQLALQNGVDTTGWNQHVSFEQNRLNRAYFDRRNRPAGAPKKGQPPDRAGSAGRPAEGVGHPQDPDGRPRGDRAPANDNRPADRRPPLLAPPSSVHVDLIRPGFQSSVSVDMGPTGFVTAYRVSGLETPEGAGPVADARKVAETELNEWLGDMSTTRLGEPEVSSTDESGSAGAHRFVWRVQPRRQQDLEFTFTFDVASGRLLFREVKPNFSEAFLEREARTHGAANQWGGIARLLLQLVLLAFACYRYTRRSMEREAPHIRALLIAVGLALFGFTILALDPYLALSRGPGGKFDAFFFYVQLCLAGLVYLLQGAVLGVSYAATEGDVRESWPGKLTSLDALLTGRLFSRNVGSSLAHGLVAGIWTFALARLALAFLAPQAAAADGPRYLELAFTRAPFLTWLLNLPIVALFNALFCLLLPLALFRRYLRRPAVVWLLVALSALLIGDLGSQGSLQSPAYWIHTAALALCALLPFYFSDFLGMVVALTISSFLSSALDLSAILPAWRESAPLGLGIAALLLVPFLAAAWRGRQLEEEEVRPEHAKNLLERLSLQAELNTARQAQLRLLPDKLPSLAGLTVAASCTPAREVTGDFYDFFPLTGGRLGLLVAEGGNDGLASALTIALAKGFLLYESCVPGDIEDTCTRLENTLGRYLRRDSGQTSLALAVLDPAAATLHLVRLGAFPKAFLVSAGGVTELLSGLARRESVTVPIQPGDSLFLCTDGLIRLWQAHHPIPLPELLRRHPEASAAALHDTILGRVRASAGAHFDDDLTAVVVRYDHSTAHSLEGAA